MRLLPRRRGRPGCDCRLCRDDGRLDARDRKAVDDVREHGVHVVLVSDSVPCSCPDHDVHAQAEPTGEPDFAYTVGLWHQRRHPELLISGLSRPEVMHRALNDLAGLVMAGEVLQPGGVWEDVLAGVAVTVEELMPAARARLVTWSSWFHRRDVPALQVVWPDHDGLFAWQGGNALLNERQPPAWRVPGPRTGALAAEPSWPFPVPPDALAVTCKHVAEREAAPLLVQRDRDPTRGEDWSILCGQNHPDTADLALLHLRHLVTGSPRLREVADLPLDHWAERPDARAAWQRHASTP